LARRRDRGVPDVIEDLEMGVVDPHRAPELERDEAHALAVTGHQGQVGGDGADQVAVGWRRPLVYGDVPDVHRVVVVLDVQEHRVLRAHAVHVHLRPPTPAPPTSDSLGPPSPKVRPEMARIGLVLGAGGSVGHAYHAGVLAGSEEGTGWDPRRAEVIVGTSAGSVVAALLRAGLDANDLARASLGEELSRPGAELLARSGRRTRLETPGPQHADVARGPS